MRLFLIVLLGLLGLCYLPVVADGGLLPRQVLLAAGAAVGLGLLAKAKAAPLRLHLPELALLAWLAWLALSRVWAVNGAEAWAVVGRWSALVGFYLMLRRGLAAGQIALGDVAAAVCAFVGAELLWVACQAGPLLATGGLLSFAQKLTGASGNKNLLSIGLFLCLPWLLWGSAAGQRRATLCRVLAGMAAGLLLILQTRSVGLGMGVAAGVYAALWALAAGRGRSARLAVAAALALALSGGAALAASGRVGRLARMESVEERLDLWRNSVQMWRDAPVAGVGAGQWQIWFPRYGLGHFLSHKVHEGVVTFQRPHNDYLWLLTEGGAVGLALYLLFYAGGVVAWLRAWRSGRGPLVRLALAALAGYAVSAAFDFPLERPELQALLLLLLAAGYSQVDSVRRSVALPGAFAWALCGLALALGLPRLNAERQATRLREAALTGNAPLAERIYKRAHSALLSVDATTVPLAWYAGVAEFQQGDFGRALPYFEEARRVAPFHVLTLNNLGSTYSKLGRGDSAEACYRRCLALSPAWGEPWLNLAAVLYNRPGAAGQAFALMRAFPDMQREPRWPLFKQTLLARRLQEARPQETPRNQARIDALLADPQFPAEAYALYEKSGRADTFWR